MEALVDSAAMLATVQRPPALVAKGATRGEIREKAEEF